MGVLRVILAICVLDAHFPGLLPFRVFSGKSAVECFFMISGYYMALAYPKYSKARHFYESRLARILPPYYLVIIISLGIFAASGFAVGEWGYLRALFTEGKFTGAGLTGWLAWATNFTLVFQDLILFLGNVHTPNIGNTATTVPLHAYLLLSVSWTIALELYFYILVPWLASLRNRILFGLLLLSLFLKIGGSTLCGLSHDPWDYRFFPFELCLFLAGFLIYRISEAYLRPNSLPHPLLCSFGILAVMIPLLQAVPGPFDTVVIILGLGTVLPMLFRATQHSKIDRMIGEFSYPIYLLHLPVGWLLIGLLKHFQFSMLWSVALVSIGTIAAASAMVAFFLPSVERLRARIKQSKS